MNQIEIIHNAQSNQPVNKTMCLNCGHVMRHNDDDLSERQIFDDDDDEDLICSKCHSKNIKLGCDFCDEKALYSKLLASSVLYSCDNHKYLIGL